MDKMTWEDMKKLDEIAERAGGYVAVHSNKDTHYNYRELAKYCKEKNIEPLDLTIRELNQFVVDQ